MVRVHQTDKPGHGEAEEGNITPDEVFGQELCVVRPNRCFESLNVILYQTIQST